MAGKCQATVLLVEDEDGIRMLMRLGLQSQGYLILEARGGEEALQISRQTRTPIDLLVTDVMMPRMNGPELAERLSRANPNLKVIFISGDRSDTVLDLNQQKVFIQKPFSVADLVKKVRTLLESQRRVETKRPRSLSAQN